MPEFTPYTILHLQLEEIADKVLPAGRYYLVIWQGGLPLGNYWLEEEGKAIALKEHQRNILEIVLPVRNLYEQNNVYNRGGVEGSNEVGGDVLNEAGDGVNEAGDDVVNKVGEGALSVVICTRNRSQELGNCIRALLDSEDADFELVVVDNASEDDRTEKVVAGFPGVRYVREDRPGLDIARNTGIRCSTGELIAYTDDDVLVGKDWTRGMKAAFADPLVMAVTGLVIPQKLDTLAQYIFEKYWSFNKGYLPRMFDHRWFLEHSHYGAPAWEIGAGANMAFRRSIFRLAGGFDERLDVGAAGCSGDSEMWYRVLAEGWNCLYLPHLVVYHLHRSSMEGLQKQLFYYMRGHVAALLVQYERYGHRGNKVRVYRGLPMYYLKRYRDSIPKDTLWTEIKGCFSGWKYYRSVRKKAGELDAGQVDGVLGLVEPDDRLSMPVVVNDQTLVSVIIAAYNHAHYLGTAIESVLNQTYKNAEIVVVDDGSTDDTEAVCRRYERVRYVRVHRVGPCAARNIGVQLSRGNFLVFLDADDYLYPNALELNLFHFGYYPDAAFVSGGHDRVDAGGQYLEGPVPMAKVGDNYTALLQGNYIGMEATVLYRRELFFRYYFDPAVPSCEDYDLNLRIARDWPVYGHAHRVAVYRIHGHNRSTDRRAMAKEAIRALKRQEPGLRNEEERAAYEEGLRNWKLYYS